MGNLFYFPWELGLMEWLQAQIPDGGLLGSLLSNLSFFGEEMLMILIMGFLYWSYDKEFGKYIGINVLMANVWNPMIKNIFLRLRPYFASDKIELRRLIDKDAPATDVAAQGFSFPSGHSSNAVTVYGSLARRLKKRWMTLLALLLPLLVGFSRIVVGAHFPTDVLCGWALGLLVIFLVPWLRKTVKNQWLCSGLLLLTALPGLFYCRSTDYFSSLGMLLGFLIAEPFEERFVRFENTRSPVRMVLRVLGGGAVYFGLNTALKLPFSSAFLASGTLPALLVRTGRYAVVIFVVIALYPMLFKYTAKWDGKK